MLPRVTLHERREFVGKTTNVRELIKKAKINEKKEKMRVLALSSLAAITMSVLATIIILY